MKFSHFNVAVSLCILALVVAVAGCSDAGTAGTVNVSGLVTLDGQPVDKAAVAFIGNGGARLASADTDSSGKFKIRASLGKNLVTVAKEGPPPPVTTESDNLMPSDGEYKKIQMSKPKAQIPSRYADPKTSGISFDISSGMPELDLALSSK